MSFAENNLLVLAVLLPLLLGAAVIFYARRRRRVALLLGEAKLIERLGARGLARFPYARLFLLVGAGLALGLAAAGPHWGYKEVPTEQRSRSVVLALDISRSMLAPDVAPNRLERERVLARRILRTLPTDRLGLIVFAGRAYILSPLTSDHSALGLYVDALDPDIVSQGGSSLASALRQATTLARGTNNQRGAAVVLVSDGEALEDADEALQIAERAAEVGVRIHTVGLGTADGARIPEVDPRTGRTVGYKRDPMGEVVITKLNQELLQSVAQKGGGQYYHGSDAGAITALLSDLRGLERTMLAEEARTQQHDRTAWFVAAALALLLLDLLLAHRQERPAAAVGGTTPLRNAAGLALVLLSLNAFAIGEIERGNRYYRAGKYAEAVQEYEKALRNGQDTPELRYNLGSALLQLGKFDEAEPHLKAALKAEERALRQRGHYNMGNRNLLPGRKGGEKAAEQLSSAIDSYKQALRLDPTDADAKWNLELAMREQDEQKQKSPSGGQDEQQQQPDKQDQSPSKGGGSGNTPNQSAAGQGQDQGSRMEQRPMSQEQADRILSAIEQDERQLTKEKLRKGQRRTPVARDW